jgi:hypothetical protein
MSGQLSSQNWSSDQCYGSPTQTRFAGLWAVMVLLCACGSGSSPPASIAPVAVDTRSVSVLLKQPLWVARDAYDASHHLMVPMHAAFAGSDVGLIRQLDTFFYTFQNTGLGDLVPGDLSGKLARLHFLYFYSRYISLSAGTLGCTPSILSHHQIALSLWIPLVDGPAWQWDRAEFPDLFSRVRWKLDQRVVAYSYYRAIIDEDLFALAIGADLSSVSSRCGLPNDSRFNEVATLASLIFTNEVNETDIGGWVLQKGVWADHPDYAYVGNPKVLPQLTPAKVYDISPDSSHSFRLPLFLVSFACSAASGTAARAKFLRLRDGLAKQWTGKVVRMPDDGFRGIRMTNFMDGENGVYRYGYPTQGAGNGFGPFELSGSVNLGWWSFLGAATSPAYSAQKAMLPLGEDVVRLYVGPNTTRTRNPLFTEPEFYRGQLISEILDAANFVALRTPSCI